MKKVKGKGGPTDDKVRMSVHEKSFVLPADTVKAIGSKGIGALKRMAHGGRVPIAVSPGEEIITPGEVHAIGVGTLEAIRQATHKPVKMADGGFLGGAIEALRLRQRALAGQEASATGGAAPDFTQTSGVFAAPVQPETFQQSMTPGVATPSGVRRASIPGAAVGRDGTQYVVRGGKVVRIPPGFRHGGPVGTPHRYAAGGAIDSGTPEFADGGMIDAIRGIVGLRQRQLDMAEAESNPTQQAVQTAPQQGAVQVAPQEEPLRLDDLRARFPSNVPQTVIPEFRKKPRGMRHGGEIMGYADGDEVLSEEERRRTLAIPIPPVSPAEGQLGPNVGRLARAAGTGIVSAADTAFNAPFNAFRNVLRAPQNQAVQQPVISPAPTPVSTQISGGQNRLSFTDPNTGGTGTISSPNVAGISRIRAGLQAGQDEAAKSAANFAQGQQFLQNEGAAQRAQAAATDLGGFVNTPQGQRLFVPESPEHVQQRQAERAAAIEERNRNNLINTLTNVSDGSTISGAIEGKRRRAAAAQALGFLNQESKNKAIQQDAAATAQFGIQKLLAEQQQNQARREQERTFKEGEQIAVDEPVIDPESGEPTGMTQRVLRPKFNLGQGQIKNAPPGMTLPELIAIYKRTHPQATDKQISETIRVRHGL